MTAHSNAARLRSALGGIFGTMARIGAAHECATARSEHRSPSKAALNTLGIDEQTFRSAVKHGWMISN